MKRMMIIGLLVAGAAASVFANGGQDDVQPGSGAYGYGYGMGPGRAGAAPYCGPGMMFWTDESGAPVTPETIDVEGSLVLEEGTIPYLEENGRKVFLMVPRRVLFNIDLENGTPVKVSGYDVTEFTRMNWSTDTDSTYLHVVSAEINGKTLNLETSYGSGYGPMMGGHHGGRGRGGW